MTRRCRASATGCTLALLVTGCALDLGDVPGAPKTCSGDDACLDLEVCSALTGSCVLRPAVAVENRLTGGFRCVPESASYGGAGLVAAWPEVASNGYRIPAAAANLTHQCGGGNLDGDVWVVVLDGARRFDSTWGALTFYRLFLMFSRDRLAQGVVAAEAVAGGLFLCPGYPTEAAWSPVSLDACHQLFRLGDDAALDLEVARLEGGGTGLVAGTLNVSLVPEVVPPDPE